MGGRRLTVDGEVRSLEANARCLARHGRWNTQRPSSRLPLPPNEKLPTELVPIRERLEHTLADLRKAFDREKQASADISHELRTPVASLLTTVEVALRKPRTAEEYRKTLDECLTMGRQMRQLVERIMALARLDSGSDRLRRRAVDIAQVVDEFAKLCRALDVAPKENKTPGLHSPEDAGAFRVEHFTRHTCEYQLTERITLHSLHANLDGAEGK